MKFSFVGIRFEPRDIWIGVYWTQYKEAWKRGVTIYICVLPLFPIIFQVYKGTSQNPC